MTIIKCSECGTEISDKAAACINCGAKPIKKTSLLTWIVGAIFLVIVFKTCSSYEEQSQTTTTTPATTATSSSSESTNGCPPNCVRIWEYSEEPDSMTGKPTQFASLKSTNSLALDFPYRGENYGHILIRKFTGKRDEVLLYFDKGQSMCRSYSNDCRIEVRFDDAQPLIFSGISSSDGDSKTIFLTPSSRFIAGSTKSQKIRVSLVIYQAGNQIFDFEPLTPLSWAGFVPSSKGVPIPQTAVTKDQHIQSDSKNTANAPKPTSQEPAPLTDNEGATTKDIIGRFVVQVGAYSDIAQAQDARDKLEGSGLTTFTQVAQTADGKRIRVRVGPFELRGDAAKAAEKIRALGFPAAILEL